MDNKPRLTKTFSAFGDLADKIEAAAKRLEGLSASDSTQELKKLQGSLGAILTALQGLKAKDRTDEVLTSLQGLSSAVSSINVNPQVNVSPTRVSVPANDFSKIESAISSLRDSIQPEKPEPVDTKSVVSAVDSVKSAIQNMRFPVANYVLPFKDSSGKAVQALVNGNGSIVATSSAQASSSTITRVATSTASATLLAANSSRIQTVIVNDATTNLYVKYGTTASATDYTYLLQPYDSLVVDAYTGRIDGILASGTGNAQINEL